MRLLSERVPITAIAVASVALLVASVTVGLRVGGTGFLSPFPDAAPLDYSAGPPGGFAPLDPRFVAGLFGSVRSGAASAATIGAGSASGGPTLGRSPLGPGRPEISAPPVAIRHVFTNDAFASPFRVQSVPFTGSTDTREATSEPGEPSSCSPIGGRTAWYAFTATRDVGLLADTLGSSYATALSVYVGSSLDDLRQIGDCSSNARGNAIVPFAATSGTTYLFQIDGPIGGRLVFTLQEQGITTRASVASDGSEARRHLPRWHLRARAVPPHGLGGKHVRRAD